MLKKIIAGIAGLTFAFSVVVSSGTLQTKAMETTTETTAEETTDTDGSEVPMTIRVLDESPNDEMYLSGDRKSTRLNSSHRCTSRMPSSA